MIVTRDGGGSISSVELGQVMRTFGWAPSELELQELISEIDQDGNGSISFNEFVWLMTKYVIQFQPVSFQFKVLKIIRKPRNAQRQGQH